MRRGRVGLTDAPTIYHALRTPPHRGRKLCSRRRFRDLRPHFPKFPLARFNRIFGIGCVRPHHAHKNEYGGCPNSCRCSHFLSVPMDGRLLYISPPSQSKPAYARATATVGQYSPFDGRRGGSGRSAPISAVRHLTPRTAEVRPEGRRSRIRTRRLMIDIVSSMLQPLVRGRVGLC